MCVRHHLLASMAPDVRFTASTTAPGLLDGPSNFTSPPDSRKACTAAQQCNTLFVGLPGKLPFMILPWFNRDSSSRSTGSWVQFR
mmetsp:Transcript_12863/g.38882  ORF Transcript_12863/g.38882 Transcript_12863/m.38882 type:complete len:85 (+) Transcript_12863:1501-1755(+)